MLLLTPLIELTPPQWQRLGDLGVARACIAAEVVEKRRRKRKQEEANQEDSVAPVWALGQLLLMTPPRFSRHHSTWKS